MIVLWILLAILIAAFVALYQYDFLFSKNRNRRRPWFALLRFFTILALLLLFIIPQFQSSRFETVLPQLTILVDDSQSMSRLDIDNQVRTDVERLKSDVDLNENYKLGFFKFSESVEILDSLKFEGGLSDHFTAMSEVQALYRDDNQGVIVLTDGIQNKGTSYQYTKLLPETRLYPVIYGDTTRYPDLKITRLNTNKFSFLNNEFPVEIVVEYEGEDEVTSAFEIKEGNQVLFSQNLKFSRSNRSQIISANLKSNRVGLKSLVAQIGGITSEKNLKNNLREFAVEVIDQQTKVAIISNFMHPDLGALKKAIESNEQRTAQILSFSDRGDINEYDLVIIYGVDSDFPALIQELDRFEKNYWIFTGPDPDLRSFNTAIESLNIETVYEVDMVQPVLEKSYSSFNLDSFNYNDYPPVEAPFGSLSTQVPIEIVMNRQIGNLITDQPLWFTYESENRRHAVSLLSGLWRWRAHSFLETRDYKNFDDLIGAHVQYLASNKKRNRLDVEVASVYQQNNSIKIAATYLDKNYKVDQKAILNIQLKSLTTDAEIIRPFVPRDNNYVVDLNGIQPDDYSYTIQVENSSLSLSGYFKVLDYNVELLASNAVADQFEELLKTDRIFYQGQIDELVNSLQNDVALKPLERKINDYFSLIDIEYLMYLFFVLLGLEWFLRKYNGLI
jgi:hypothetical protein